MAIRNGIDPADVRLWAIARLEVAVKQAKKAAKEFDQEAERCYVAGQLGKRNGHLKRAAYWRNVASGFRWLIRTWGK